MSDWEPQVDDRDRAHPAQRRPKGNGVVRFLWAVIALLIVVGAGIGVSFFTGAISIAQPTANVPTPTPRPVQPPAAQSAAPGAQGTAAAPANAAAAKPIVTKTQTFGDWIYTCVKRQASDPKAQCSIVQQLSDSKSKAPLFLWRIAAGDKGLVGEWQTRTGVMVDRGITLDAGTEKPIVIPFQLCTPTGCQAVANLAPDFIDALGKAQKASATVFPIGAKGVLLTLSVKGLPDALAALKTP